MLRFFVKFCIVVAAFTWLMLTLADMAGAATPQQTIHVEVAEPPTSWVATVAAGAAALTALVGLEEFVRRRRRRPQMRRAAPYQMPGESRTEALDRIYRTDPPPAERRTVQPPLPSNPIARRQERLRRQREGR